MSKLETVLKLSKEFGWPLPADTDHETIWDRLFIASENAEPDGFHQSRHLRNAREVAPQVGLSEQRLWSRVDRNLSRKMTQECLRSVSLSMTSLTFRDMGFVRNEVAPSLANHGLFIGEVVADREIMYGKLETALLAGIERKKKREAEENRHDRALEESRQQQEQAEHLRAISQPQVMMSMSAEHRRQGEQIAHELLERIGLAGTRK